MANPYRPFRTTRTPARVVLEVSAPTEFANGRGPICPDLLELAPPKGFPPSLFDPNRDLDKFVVAMALAFNDLRDCMWVVWQAENGKPASDRMDGYDGARMGMHLWATRVVIGILHEVFKAIEEFSRVIDSENVKDIVARYADPDQVKAWKNLATVAVDREAPIRKCLMEIRNKLSFHYKLPGELAAGYTTAFLNRGEPTESTELAYVSRGPTVASTRFYFADAAAQQASALEMNKLEVEFAAVDRVVLDVAGGLSALVCAVVDWRLTSA